MEKQKLNELAKFITEKMITMYKEVMSKSINGRVEENDTWLIENVVKRTLEALNDQKRLGDFK